MAGSVQRVGEHWEILMLEKRKKAKERAREGETWCARRTKPLSVVYEFILSHRGRKEGVNGLRLQNVNFD